MICILIDCKFEADSNSVHVKVIGGHLRGHKRSFWGQKSEMCPNAHDIHMDRFKYKLCISYNFSLRHFSLTPSSDIDPRKNNEPYLRRNLRR